MVQQGGMNVSFNIQPGSSLNSSGGAGGTQNISIIGETTPEGDFDQFLPLANVSGSNGYLLPGNETGSIQTVNVFTNGTDTGNATSYLVPERGFTVISDIDDTLRVTQIYEPATALMNTFAYAFTPWLNMPSIYANWSSSIPDFHFHYLTTTPEQVTPNYMSFILDTYPPGSFDTRPLNFSNADETLSVRKYLLEKIFQTYPQRKFILMGDTSNSDVMKDYPAMVTEFPGQVQCILLRNISATDSGDKFPYDTSGFQGLNQSMYMFYQVPNDLMNLDILDGECVNKTVVQNITFSDQGLPFGLSKKSEAGRMVALSSWGNLAMVAWIMAFGFVFGGI